MKTHQQALDIAGDYDNLSDQIQAYIKARGMVAVSLRATGATIERRFDTQDWEASDYSDAAEQYEKWISAAPNPFEGEE